jgi:hypothetical protein
MPIASTKVATRRWPGFHVTENGQSNWIIPETEMQGNPDEIRWDNETLALENMLNKRGIYIQNRDQIRI